MAPLLGLPRFLSDHGLDARKVEDIVRENTEAEQGYIGLFQAYLGIGLLIGIIALAVTEARAVEERRRDIAMLRAVGIKRGTISRIFYTEAAFVGLVSLCIGIVAGLLLAMTSQPLWGGSSGLALPIQFLLVFSLLLIMILLISTVVPASRASKVRPAMILREEG